MDESGMLVDGPYSTFQCFKPGVPVSPLLPGLYLPSNCLIPENWITKDYLYQFHHFSFLTRVGQTGISQSRLKLWHQVFLHTFKSCFKSISAGCDSIICNLITDYRFPSLLYILNVTFTLMLKESEPSTTHITSTTGSAGGGGGKSSQLHDPLTEMASSFAFVTIATFAVISMLKNIFQNPFNTV